jgi:peptidylprolyl isomerase
MKKLIVAHSLVAASLVLAGCQKAKNTDTVQVEPTKQQESKTMSRHTLDSGLEYEIVKEGTGETPQKGKQVTVHYTGWLDDNGKPGTKFDSSVDRGQAFTFVIGTGQVIKGWDEGVMGMKVGEKRRLIIPANLGYGARGAGRSIPGNATLIFDVELLKVS